MDSEYSAEVCSRYLRSSAVKHGFAVPNGMVGCNPRVIVAANVWFSLMSRGVVVIMVPYCGRSEYRIMISWTRPLQSNKDLLSI